MHFFNEDDGVAMGDPLGGYFEIYTTINGGEVWTRVPSADIPAPVTGEYGITADYSASANHIWFGTNKGRVYHSADKGYHWTVSTTLFGSAEVVQPEFADTLNGIVYRSYLDMGIEPALNITTDGGLTWQSVFVGGTMYARYFTHIPGTAGTYVSSSSLHGSNGISYSTDGGYNWSVITSGYDFMATAWLDNQTGWAGSIAMPGKTVGGMYIYDGPPLGPILAPVISVDPLSFTKELAIGTTANETLNISNIGDADLEYQVHVIFEIPLAKNTPVSLNGNGNVVRSLSHNGSGMSVDPNAKPAGYNPPTDDVVLNYDGDNYSAIGWSVVPITPTVAAMFPCSMTLPYAGMFINSVDVYINDPGTDFVLKIYGMDNNFQPGTLLVSQPFTGTSLSWNNIILSTPVYITGADIWVGYTFTQTVLDTFIPGTDAGPANPFGDFISTGGGWQHLSSNPALNYNWNIRANLQGTPMTQWLSVNPTGGTVIPGATAPVTVTFDATSLTVGTYHATLRIQSNDAITPQVDVPVELTVTSGGTPGQIKLDFELQEDFSLTFDPWTVLDVDGGITYGLSNATFPHMYEPMAFIAFNPASTTPPMNDDPEILPHGGVRFGACFATVPPPYNDDWLIFPPVNLGTNSSFTLWVKSYTDTYGLEQYNIGVSTTGNNPADFTIISGSTPLEAPIVWTEVSFDLAAYDGQTVYVAIQCVSPDRFIFMVDDITIDYFVGVPETPAGKLSVYPNPATDHLTITAAGMNQVEIL